MMRKCLIWILLLTLNLSVLVDAQTLHVRFGVIINESVAPDLPRVMIREIEYNEFGEATRRPFTTGSYKIEILDPSEKVLSSYIFEPSLVLCSEPWGCVPGDISFETIDLRYYSTSKYLVFYKGKEELLRIDLSKYSKECNNDGNCDYMENSIFCSKDCAINEDYACTPFMDDICDKDCISKYDIDCDPNAEKPKTAGEKLAEYKKEKRRRKEGGKLSQGFWEL